MTHRWRRATIHDALVDLAGTLETPVETHLVGGSAMVVHDLKETTPDIDLFVTDDEAVEHLGEGLATLGFERTVARDVGDGRPHLRRFIDGRDREVDVIRNRIARMFTLSPSMAARSDAYLREGPLTVSVISPEDIYLGKLAHSARRKDAPDAARLLEAELDVDVIREELEVQADLVDGDLPDLVMFGGGNTT